MLVMLFQGIVGSINTPEHLSGGYGDVAGDNGGGGLLGLVSNLVKLVIAVGGLWAFVNLLLAGFVYITSGDKPDELVKAHQRIYMSILGLVVMIGSFAITMIVSFLLYGNASTILNPVISGPGAIVP